VVAGPPAARKQQEPATPLDPVAQLGVAAFQKLRQLHALYQAVTQLRPPQRRSPENHEECAVFIGCGAAPPSWMAWDQMEPRRLFHVLLGNSVHYIVRYHCVDFYNYAFLFGSCSSKIMTLCQRGLLCQSR